MYVFLPNKFPIQDFQPRLIVDLFSFKTATRKVLINMQPAVSSRLGAILFIGWFSSTSEIQFKCWPSTQHSFSTLPPLMSQEQWIQKPQFLPSNLRADIRSEMHIVGIVHVGIALRDCARRDCAHSKLVASSHVASSSLKVDSESPAKMNTFLCASE